jgi:hypothetical protein
VAAIREGLEKEGKRVVTLVGGQSAESKDAAVVAFQAGEADVFVGNIKAAGVGITLTASSTVIFAELDWVPANVTQAEDRCHRIGQVESVLVQHIVLEGSLDQRLAQAIVEKQRIADAALDNNLTRLDASEAVVALKDVDAAGDLKGEEKAYSEAAIAEFLRKLRYLAAVCDGARELDDHGFNKFDSRFGKALAAQTSLTQNQAKAAARLCNKYRRQLENK